jgi:hypothetical protein
MRFLICAALLSVCSSLLAQTPDPGIDIDGVRVMPGLAVDDALALLAGKVFSRDWRKLPAGTPLYISAPKGPGGVQRLNVIVGALHIDHGVVAGACKSWGTFSGTDSELARALFAALGSPGTGGSTENAVIETSIKRTPEETVEILVFHEGQRTTSVVRQQHYGLGASGLELVDVEECDWLPGYTTSADSFRKSGG